MWDPQWSALTDDHQVIRCDLRGYGETPIRADEPFSNADDVRALLESLDITGATLIGSSSGGRIALQIASAWPELVSRLVLLCPLYDLPPTPAVRRFGRREDALLNAGDIEAATELNVITWLGEYATDETRDAVREMQRHAFEVQMAAGDDVPQEPGPPIDLSAIDVPALVVSGDNDLDFFRDIAAHLAENLPQAHHVALPWAWHLPNMHRPDEINELIRGFLAGDSGDTPGPGPADPGPDETASDKTEPGETEPGETEPGRTDPA
jgi:3-oxoadipate enol-lactonase